MDGKIRNRACFMVCRPQIHLATNLLAGVCTVFSITLRRRTHVWTERAKCQLNICLYTLSLLSQYYTITEGIV